MVSALPQIWVVAKFMYVPTVVLPASALCSPTLMDSIYCYFSLLAPVLRKVMPRQPLWNFPLLPSYTSYDLVRDGFRTASSGFSRQQRQARETVLTSHTHGSSRVRSSRRRYIVPYELLAG